MLEWLKKLLVGPEMTLEERITAIKVTESMLGRRVYHLDGAAAFQLIKERGFPVRGDDERYRN